MSQIECGRGHFYDPSIYSVCPHCNGSAMPNKTVPLTGYATGGSNPYPAGRSAMGANATAPIGSGYQPVRGFQSGQSVMANNVTVPVDGANAYGGFVPGLVTDPGKTMPPIDYKGEKVTDDGKTRAMGEIKVKNSAVRPVVGWLVCVKGAAQGKDYRIHSQKNIIGRSKSADICIEGDKGISSEHLVIAYDERGKAFVLADKSDSNNSYVNGKLMISQIELAAYDIIEIGNSQLLFIPLCSDRFDWSSYLDKQGGADGE